MAIKIGDLLFHDWLSYPRNGGWSDIFIFKMSPYHGLPPGDYAKVVRKLANLLVKIRSSAGIWVLVATPDSWYTLAVKYALWDFPLPLAVTKPKVMPDPKDFTYGPYFTREHPPPLESTEPYVQKSALTNIELACLRVLARSDCAYSKEIASLTGVEESEAVQAMERLAGDKFVELKPGKWKPYWKIRRPGVAYVLRSWWMPPGKTISMWRERGYPACKERDASAYRSRRSSSGRHRRTARLFPAWLRQAWPRADIIAGWTEVTCYGARPDALCWGKLDGVETLIWLEVESGNRSRWNLQSKILRRFSRGLIYARTHQIRLVFVVLGPFWVRNAIVPGFTNLPPDVAVVFEDWKAFGWLQAPSWGKVRWSDKNSYRSLRKLNKVDSWFKV